MLHLSQEKQKKIKTALISLVFIIFFCIILFIRYENNKITDLKLREQSVKKISNLLYSLINETETSGDFSPYTELLNSSFIEKLESDNQNLSILTKKNDNLRIVPIFEEDKKINNTHLQQLLNSSGVASYSDTTNTLYILTDSNDTDNIFLSLVLLHELVHDSLRESNSEYPDKQKYFEDENKAYTVEFSLLNKILKPSPAYLKNIEFFKNKLYKEWSSGNIIFVGPGDNNQEFFKKMSYEIYPHPISEKNIQDFAFELWLDFNFQIIEGYTNKKEERDALKIKFLEKAQEYLSVSKIRSI